MITRLEIIDHRPCPGCDGEGMIPGFGPCGSCGGAGANGRIVITNPNDGAEITYQEQDNGRTLKVYIKESKKGVA